MKYKSYAFWTSLSAAIVVLVGTLAQVFGFEADEKIVNDIIMGVCGILIVFGVVKMPSAKTTTDEQEKKDDTDNQ